MDIFDRLNAALTEFIAALSNTTQDDYVLWSE